MIEKISHYFSKQLAANTEEEEILQEPVKKSL